MQNQIRDIIAIQIIFQFLCSLQSAKWQLFIVIYRQYGLHTSGENLGYLQSSVCFPDLVLHCKVHENPSDHGADCNCVIRLPIYFGIVQSKPTPATCSNRFCTGGKFVKLVVQ